MRVLFRAAVAALVLVAAPSGSCVRAGRQKIAYITSSALLEQAPGRAEAEAQFDKETGAYREQIKRMSDSLNTMVSAFEKAPASSRQRRATTRHEGDPDAARRSTSGARRSSSSRAAAPGGACAADPATG